MSTPKEIVFNLLERLLAGERGEVPMQLAMVLEKSSSLGHGDSHYRQILPARLAELRIPQDVRDEIIARVRAEVARNPDADLISVSMSTRTDLSIKAIVEALVKPPRPLKLLEYAVALSYLSTFLPICLEENTDLLPRVKLEQLARLVNDLKYIKHSDTDEDRAAGNAIDHFAPQLLMSLEDLGIRES